MDPGLFVFGLLILVALWMIAHYAEKAVWLLKEIRDHIKVSDGVKK